MSYEVSSYPVEKLEPNAEIHSGFAFKSERFTDNPDDIPLVKGENVHQGYIDWIRAKRWPADEYDALAKYHLETGDIVLAMDRPWVAAGLKWSYVKPHDPNSLLVQRVARLRAKKKLDQDYLRHVISSNYFASYLQPIVTGVNVPHISGKQIGAFRIPIPKPEIQRKIAGILTAYDDLIETNKRRIALLEKMAEELYREWFVRMRFPGHQNTKFVKGVPEGWQEVELREICDEASKSTKPGEHLSDRYYLPLDSLATRQMLPLDHHDYTEAQSSLVLFEKGDILFGAMRPYQHKVVIAPFKGVTRTTMFVIRPKKDSLHSYCYLNLFQSSSIEYATLICNGADRPYAVWNRAMERMKVFLPHEDTLNEFEKMTGPILANIREFYFIQRKLAEARDLLLPRLISGKLSVEDLDIQFPPSMREEAPEPELEPADA